MIPWRKVFYKFMNSWDNCSTIRERRMWTCAFAVVVAIFLTLVFSSSLNKLWHSQTLSAVVFLAAMALVGSAVLAQGLKARPKNIEIGVAFGIAAVYLMFFLRLSLPERSHLIEYSVLAVFLYEALAERARHGRLRFPWAWAIMLSSLIGALDEFVQRFMPSRHFDWDDILFNTLASALAVVAVSFLRWMRKPRERTET